MQTPLFHLTKLSRADATETGLTLIEMIVVLAIIALVAALIVPSVINRPDQARVTLARADMKAISTALRLYRLDNGNYPTTVQGLAALVTIDRTMPSGSSTRGDGYLAQIPIDPWGHPYRYRNPDATGNGFDLVSLGRDGQPGGDGVAADLSETARF